MLNTYHILIFSSTLDGTRQVEIGLHKRSTNRPIRFLYWTETSCRKNVKNQAKGKRMPSLRILFLNKAGTISFSALFWQDGVQYPTFGEICCIVGLLADGAESMGAMVIAFFKL